MYRFYDRMNVTGFISSSFKSISSLLVIGLKNLSCAYIFFVDVVFISWILFFIQWQKRNDHLVLLLLKRYFLSRYMYLCLTVLFHKSQVELWAFYLWDSSIPLYTICKRAKHICCSYPIILTLHINWLVMLSNNKGMCLYKEKSSHG